MRQKKKWNCVAVTTSASADPVRISGAERTSDLTHLAS